MLRLQLDGAVIVGHGQSELAQGVARLCPGNEEFKVVGQEFDGAGQARVGERVIVLRKRISPLETPGISLTRIFHQQTVNPAKPAQRVALLDGRLGLHHISAVKAGPPLEQIIEVGVGCGVIFDLQQAERAVVARALVLGQLLERTGIVRHGTGKVVVVDAA